MCALLQPLWQMGHSVLLCYSKEVLHHACAGFEFLLYCQLS